MANICTLTLMVNEHVLLRDTPVYAVRSPRLPGDHLILELSLTPTLMETIMLFVQIWHAQRPVDWGLYWHDQDGPEIASGYLHGLTLTFYPQALVQLVVATLPAAERLLGP